MLVVLPTSLMPTPRDVDVGRGAFRFDVLLSQQQGQSRQTCCVYSNAGARAHAREPRVVNRRTTRDAVLLPRVLLYPGLMGVPCFWGEER